jgi:hypothetical protein
MIKFGIQQAEDPRNPMPSKKSGIGLILKVQKMYTMRDKLRAGKRL